MRTIGNILWLVLGGFFMGLGWWLAGLLCAITIIGIPWAKACFVIGQFAFWPFGQEAVSREEPGRLSRLRERRGVATKGVWRTSGGRSRVSRPDRGVFAGSGATTCQQKIAMP